MLNGWLFPWSFVRLRSRSRMYLCACVCVCVVLFNFALTASGNYVATFTQIPVLNIY